MECIEVETISQAIAMSFVRNECREFMTNFTGVISVGMQVEWFRTEYEPGRCHDMMHGFIMGIIKDKKVIVKPTGFGLLAYKKGKWWVTGGLSKKSRNKGLGRVLFNHMISYAEKHGIDELWLDVRSDNDRAIKLYGRLGFTKISEALGVIVMKLKLEA